MNEIENLASLAKYISDALQEMAKQEGRYCKEVRNTMEIYSWYTYKLEYDLKEIFKVCESKHG